MLEGGIFKLNILNRSALNSNRISNVKYLGCQYFLSSTMSCLVRAKILFIKQDTIARQPLKV